MSQFVEVTRRGLGTRSKNSIGGVFVGLILVAVGVFFLFWNEGRAVKRYKDLKEGAGAVVSVEVDKVDPSAEGKLVHLSGETNTSAPLVEADFGISVSAIKLVRTAEIYQWVEVVKTEEKSKTGGSSEQTKTYSYRKEWRSAPVDSSQFKVTGVHQNPTEMKYRSGTLTAEGVTMGAFRLPQFLVAKIGGARSLPIENLDRAQEEVRNSARLNNGGVYFGSDPVNPAVGDIRVHFQVVPTGPVSVVAQQQGDSFVSFRTSTGGQLDLIESGVVSAPDMFQKAQDREKMLTWAIRVGGFFLLGIAFSMILRPIAVLASILPFLGRLVGTATGFIGFLIAGIVWTATVAVAWIFYRPLLGVAILLVTVALSIMVLKRIRKGGGTKAGAAIPEGPPPLT